MRWYGFGINACEKNALHVKHLTLVFLLVFARLPSSLHQSSSHKCNPDTSSNTHFHTPTQQLTDKHTAYQHNGTSIEHTLTLSLSTLYTRDAYIGYGQRAGQRVTAYGWICHGNQSRHMINRLTVLSCVKNKLDTGKVSSVKIKRANNIFSNSFT